LISAEEVIDHQAWMNRFAHVLAAGECKRSWAGIEDMNASGARQVMMDLVHHFTKCPRVCPKLRFARHSVKLRIAGDEPIAETTWNGISAQNSYAITRQDLLLRYGPICQGCGQSFPADELSAHHKQAQRADGKHGQANLELLCQCCHIQTPSYGKCRKM